MWLRRIKKQPTAFAIVSLAFCCACFGARVDAFSPPSFITTRLPTPVPALSKNSISRYQQYFAKVSHDVNQSNKEYPLRARQWEGDDVRFSSKLRRRLFLYSQNLTPAKSILVFINIILFTYQVVNSVNYLRLKHPSYWPSQALEMIGDVLLGTSIVGPLTADFVHQVTLSRWQPHRYLTAGFLHGSLLHLGLNMNSLRQTPSWLETGLGWPLFVTTFLVGIVSGNLWHSWSSLDNSMCIGASGGICALWGIMFVSLIKMGNNQMGMVVLKNMGMLLLFGFMLSNVSNAAHLGGFLGGIAMGVLCVPSYRKSYALSRKNSLDVDPADRQYRLAMGFGKVPSRRGLVPLSLLWTIAIVALAVNPLYRRIPIQIVRGLSRPGVHSNMRPIPAPSL